MVYRRRFPVRGRRVYRRRGVQRRPMYKRPYTGRTKVRDHLAVYHNAFSTATTNPKIPDGKCYHSAGIRLQSVGEWTNDGNGQMDFLFFPGINNGIVAAQCLPNPITGFHQPYSQHFVLNSSNEQSPDAEVAKWRLVSQATKVNLVNNSDENDGWWEAIRVQLGGNLGPDGFGLVPIGTATKVIGATAANNIPGMNLGITQLVEHPTYCTGKLRDIHRHIFDLMPQGSDHEFRMMKFDMSTSVDLMVDQENYDAIFLRIHGRPGAATPTRVMIHQVSNQELLFQESATMSRFHSEADNHEQIFINSKRRRQNGPHTAAKKARTAIVSATY